MTIDGTTSARPPASAPAPSGPGARSTQTSALVVLATIAVVAALHVGQEVFLPLAMAMLIAFALSPPVSFVRKFGVPLIASVLAVATVAFALLGLFVLVVAAQFAELAEELPTFQSNIVSKLNAFEESMPDNGLVARLSRMAATISSEISSALPTDAAPDAAADPVTVQVVEDKSAFQTLSEIAVPLLSPVATTGIVIVVVIFMLIERDELRDRLIRLVGANDINRTTQVIEDAGSRVGTYLLMQLLVNVIYAIPIGVGLWFIGVPNALLWGLLTLVLRFLPYVGPILAAAFPLFLAFSVSPGWSTVLWTAALFLTVEIVSSNLIEPWLYGSRTGVSALAIIVAAIFWTAVWGPAGLVLSTPLTVVLVVVGRYLPQFAIFEVMFGDRPALAPHSRLYQRLLVGDFAESTLRAEEMLEDAFIADYHRDVGLPALFLAQSDHEGGLLSGEQEARFADAATLFLAELDHVARQELAEATEAPAAEADDTRPAAPALPGVGFHLLSIGGRTQLDDLAAHMFAQSAVAEGAEVSLMTHADLSASRFPALTATGAGCILLHFLDVSPSRASLLHIRRLKRAAPALRVGVVLWQPTATQESRLPRRVPEEKKQEALEIGADFCATSMEEALAGAFTDTPAVAVVEPARKRRSRAILGHA